MGSIRHRLMAWILGALAVGALVLVAVSYLVALDEVDEIFDENLKQVALAVALHAQPAGAAPRLRRDLPALPAALEAAAEFDFVTSTWRADGTLVASSAPEIRLPFVAATGRSTAVVGDEVWRLYAIATADGVAQAARRESSSAAVAAESAAQLVPPLLGLLALIAVLLTIALRRGLRPLGAMAEEVARRSAASLEPIDEAATPPEIAPLIGSINGLMRRLAQAFAAQRRFVADAAHELRSPLTALRLQLQLLERAGDAAARTRALGELKVGIDRAQRLVEQLLSLSRIEAEVAPRDHFAAVDLCELVREVLGVAAAEAEHKGLDLGADLAAPAWISGDRHALVVLLQNLVGNAIRYTPPGGCIDVRVTGGADDPLIEVVDDGPGIATAERPAMFRRFHRGEAGLGSRETPGSGLGLAICRAISERHGASIELTSPESGAGLRVVVTFPSHAARPETGGQVE